MILKNNVLRAIAIDYSLYVYLYALAFLCTLNLPLPHHLLKVRFSHRDSGNRGLALVSPPPHDKKGNLHKQILGI